MSSPEDFVTAAYQFLADGRSFRELHVLATEVDLELFFTQKDSLASRLSAEVMGAAAEQADGLLSPDEARERVMEVLRIESLRHLRASSMTETQDDVEVIPWPSSSQVQAARNEPQTAFV